MARNMEEADVLRELEPTVEEQLNRHYKQAKMWYPHDYIPYSEGENFGALAGRKDVKDGIELPGRDWDRTQSKLSEVAQVAWLVNLLTEDNLPSYHREIATMFGQDGGWGTWVGQWTAEENRHGVAMREFAHVTRAIDPILLEDIRMVHMKGGYQRNDKSPLNAVAYVTFQELATRIAHRNTGELIGREGNVLGKELLARIATDENLHMVFYRSLGKAALDIAPNLMMRAVTKEVVGFSMPGDTIPDFYNRARQIAEAGIYDLPLHHSAVLTPVLREWNIEHREDLTGDGAAARDELMQFMGGLKSLADTFAEKREIRRAKAIEG